MHLDAPSLHTRTCLWLILWAALILRWCPRAALWTQSHTTSHLLMESLCLISPIPYPRTWASTGFSSSVLWVTPASQWEWGRSLLLTRPYPRWKLLVILGFLYACSVFMTWSHAYSPTGNLQLHQRPMVSTVSLNGDEKMPSPSGTGPCLICWLFTVDLTNPPTPPQLADRQFSPCSPHCPILV